MFSTVAALMRAALAFIVLGALYATGRLHGALATALVLAVPVTAVFKMVVALKGGVDTQFFRHAADRGRRRQLAAAILWGTTWGLLAWELAVSIPAFQLGAEGTRQARTMLGGSALLLVALGFFPRREPGKALPWVLGGAVVMLVTQAYLLLIPQVRADAVALPMPVAGTWHVMHGGLAPFLNQHHPLPSQRHALDLVKLANGEWIAGPQEKPESYPAWDSAVFSPADGTVVTAVDEVADSPPGQADAAHPLGNHVVVDIGEGRFFAVLHLRRSSVVVRAGQRVACGELLGRAGNSGVSFMPHVHAQVSDGADLMAPATRSLPWTPLATASRDGTSLPPRTLVQRGDVVDGAQGPCGAQDRADADAKPPPDRAEATAPSDGGAPVKEPAGPP